jgi:hypothetical protein
MSIPGWRYGSVTRLALAVWASKIAGPRQGVVAVVRGEDRPKPEDHRIPPPSITALMLLGRSPEMKVLGAITELRGSW